MLQAREPSPLRFPVEALVPETTRHLEVRTALFLILKRHFASGATIGSEQFVYWDPTSPTECVAPDAFVRLGVPHDDFDSWKVWERGAPELAVEITSRSDARDRDWDDKVRKYHRLGVKELVRFDPDDREKPLRVWAFRDAHFAESVLESPRSAACETLSAFWVVTQDSAHRLWLRLAADAEGKALLATTEEGELAERTAKEAERTAKEAAQRRVAELEAELAKRGG